MAELSPREEPKNGGRMSKIVVGYDGSNSSKEALKLAKTHARAFGAEVHVVSSLTGGPEVELQEIQNVEHDLEYTKSLFDEDKIPCETHLLIRGLTPGEDLVQFAHENSASEIIIGIKRRSKVGKLLFGSNAQYVILKASCPVVTVK
jgi:nucleotide-binding universal stress UspA family protein